MSRSPFWGFLWSLSQDERVCMVDDTIHFRCPQCTHSLKIKRENAGKKAYCPVCFYRLTVPEKSEAGRKSASPESLYGVDATPRDTQKMADRFAFGTVRCPVCGTDVAVREDQLGQKVSCPDCETLLSVDQETLTLSVERQARLRRQQMPFEHKNEKENASPDSFYAIRSQNEPSPSDRVNPKTRLFPVHCPLCDTLMYASSEQIGTSFQCPDCETVFQVTAPLPKSDHSSTDIRSYEGGSVYGLNPESQTLLKDIDQQAQTIASTDPKGVLIPVRCELCGTLLYASKNEIGKKKCCPDCGHHSTVRDLTEDEKIAQIRVEPKSTGSYSIYGEDSQEREKTPPHSSREFPAIYGPQPPRRSQPSQRSGPPKPSNEEKTRRNSSRRADSVLDQLAEFEALATGSEVEPSSAPQAPLPTKRKKKNRSHRSKSQYDEFNGLVPEIDDRGNVLLRIPSPPNPTMGWSLFAPVFHPMFLTRWLSVLIYLVSIFVLFYLSILPLYSLIGRGKYELNAGASMAMVCLSAIAGALLLLALRAISVNLFSVFEALSSGAKQVLEWREEDFFDGIILLLRLFFPIFYSLLPLGFMRFLSIDLPFTPMVGMVLFLLIFPVSFLSSLLTGIHPMPICKTVFSSFFERLGTWMGFYFWSAVLVALPLFGLMMIPSGGWLREILRLLLSIVIPPIYSVLLGRLGWVIGDYRRGR